MAKKAKPKPGRESERYKLYSVSGDKAERKNPFCPKCGPGYFMAVHKDRKTCGKCSYMEKSAKK